MHWKFGLLSPGKASSHSTALPIFSCVFPFCCVQRFRVFIRPVMRPTLLWQMDMGSLTCARIWVRAVHTKAGQAQRSLHKSWLWGTEKLSLTLPRRRIEPRAVFVFEFRRSTHWATSPVVMLLCRILAAVGDVETAVGTVRGLWSATLRDQEFVH